MAPLTEDDQTNIALVVLWPIATILVGLRSWVKAARLHSFGSDDVNMIVAWVSFTVFALALYLESTVPDHSGIEDAQKSVTLTTISNIFYPITSIFLKASIGLFFLRLMPDNRGRVCIWIIIALSSINNVFQMCFMIFLCGNPLHFWQEALNHKCLRTDAIIAAWYEQAAVNSLVDFALVGMPIWTLWNTIKSRQTRVAIGLILLLGTAGSVFSVIRMPFISRILRNNRGDALEAVELWSTLELGMGIIAACLPMLSSFSKSLAQVLKSRTWSRTQMTVSLPHGRWR